MNKDKSLTMENKSTILDDLAGIGRLHDGAVQRGRPFRILMVDDEPWVHDMFTEFFAETDAVEVDHVETGGEAIDKVRTADYDLITLDIIMPEVSGLEVLTSIKEIDPHLPVMVVTGNATDRLIRESGMLGASRVLYKPFRLEEFVDEVAGLLV